MRLLCLVSVFTFLFGFSFGINYKQKPQDEVFYLYDYLVVNKNAKIKKVYSKNLEYISLFEHKDLPYKKIGRNEAWDNYIYDLNDISYQKYLLSLIDKRFDGIFFDTVDSYLLTNSDQKDAIVKFIKKVKKLYPNKIIVLNRGFEVYDKLRDVVDIVVAENLFFLNGKENKKNYLNLLNALKKVKNPVVVEYSDNIEVAKKILNLGFTPFLSNKEFTKIGISSIVNIPRKILVLYDDFQVAHRLYQMPIEFLGYVPILKPVSKIPKDFQEYAGIVVVLVNTQGSKKLYKALKSSGLKFVILGNINGKEFGFKEVKPIKELIRYKKFEIIPSSDLSNYYMPKEYKGVIEYKNFVSCAYTPFGGYCQNPYVEVADEAIFSVDIFKFIKNALNLKPIPLPDITTENGRRILISHVDGDGFLERFNNKFASEVLYEEIFKRYKIPIGVSIIVGDRYLYPKYSKKFEEIAKKIFSLKNIEPASHTFSHPFTWDKNPKHLNIKGYRFDLKKELVDSVRYVEKLSNKKALLYFSGNCEPSKEALEILEKNQILSINGGDTTITFEAPFISRISPFGIKKGDYWQIYAPMTNENVYTNLWKNKAGYIKAIQTIKLTESPRRLKPIDIYYHFYSGATPASLIALKRVYDYALKDAIALKVSDWVKLARAFYSSVVAKDLKKGGYVLRGDIRCAKIEGKKEVNIKLSDNVVGYRFQKGYTYIFFAPNFSKRVVFGKNNMPYLIEANARIKSYKKLKNGYEIIFESFGKIEAIFKLFSGYKIVSNAKKIKNGNKLKLVANKVLKIKVINE